MERIRAWLRSDMRVLRWVFLTLYLSMLGGLTTPFALHGKFWFMWAILVGVVVVSLLLFIFGAGTVNLCRPIERRRLWMPVLAAATMLALLVLGSLLVGIELFEVENFMEGDTQMVLVWGGLLTSWAVWGMLLWVYAQGRERYKVLSRLTTLLFAGSLAELLAAVPAHIIVSKRPGWLVGLGTMLGIIAGINVMMFSFGPAIVLLFLRPRYRREQMEAPSTCRQCGYNLTGTLMAGRLECPECGAAIMGVRSRREY